MRAFLKRLYRERRRLVIVASLTFVGGYIAFLDSPAVIYGLPMPVIAGCAIMLGLTAFLGAIVVLFPRIRNSAEVTASGIPVLAMMNHLDRLDDGGLSTTAMIYMVLFCYLGTVVYSGTLLDRFLPRRTVRFKSYATSRLRPEELWPYLTVNPDTFSDYGDKDTLSMEWLEPGVTYREIARSGELATIEEIHTIEAHEPFRRYRFAYRVPDATELATSSQGVQEYNFYAESGCTRLEVCREFNNLTLRGRLFSWIDDGLGRVDDKYVSRAEAQHASKLHQV